MPEVMQALLDRVQLNDLMNRYAVSIDLRDWARLRSVFAERVEADFTSMGTRAVFRGPAEDWVAAIRSTISGFDATQHFLANHSVELDGDRATDLRYMQARHVLDGAQYTIAGYYTSEMSRTRAGWRIARYRLTVTWTDGDRRLMGIAYRKSTGKA